METERNVLTVSANKSREETDREYTHRGISYKTFARNWQMADDVEIEEVEFENGLLTILLRKELPENQKRKTWF